MKEIRVEFEKFDFEGFVSETLKGVEEIVDTDYAILKVHEVGKSPIEPELNEKRDYLKELKESNFLFFTFSDVNIGNIILCADGNEYELDDEDDSDLCMGDNDSLGFLIQYKNGQLIINSANHSIGSCTMPPSIDIIEDCSVFDEGMEKFIKKFIR